MNLKRDFRFIVKLSLIDELVGIIYWAVALYGIYLLINCISSAIFLAITLVIYIVTVSIGYILFLKALNRFLKVNKK